MRKKVIFLISVILFLVLGMFFSKFIIDKMRYNDKNTLLDQKNNVEINKETENLNIKTCNYTYSNQTVIGSSMEPIIHNNQTYILIDNYYNCNPLNRGDIIAFNNSQNKFPLIKMVRVIEGDELDFKNSTLFVNKNPLVNSQNQTYIFSEKQKLMISLYVENNKLKDGLFLIFGENIHDSTDSRRIGAIDYQGVIGKFIIE